MRQNIVRFSAPDFTGIFEIADQFLLLAIDTYYYYRLQGIFKSFSDIRDDAKILTTEDTEDRKLYFFRHLSYRHKGN
ncbi:hypothetical protein QUF80_10615 [Desulfococcaceae bacterium HSG8]|nr:hypothetical protein [Desulfococcaceae bacterium HSG8]